MKQKNSKKEAQEIPKHSRENIRLNQFYKNISRLLILVLMVSVIGCGRGGDNCGSNCQENETQETNPDGTDSGGRNGGNNGGSEPPQTVTEEILIDELVTSKIELGTLRPNDLLHFKIKGEEVTPSFSAIYENVYSSSWDVKECDRFCPRCEQKELLKLANKGECFWFKKSGSCRHRFRNRLEDRVKSLEFSNDLKSLRLKLKLGNKVFLLGKVVGRSETKTLTSLKLTRKHLEEDTEGELFIESLPVSNVKTGFLGFGACEGIGQMHFKTSGPVNSSIVDSNGKHKFIVSASVEYIEEENEGE